jgi:hypothetical protein
MKSLFKKVPAAYDCPENYQAKYKNHLVHFGVWKKHTKVVVKHNQREDFIHFEDFSEGSENGYCLNDMFDFVCDKIDNDASMGHQR